MNSFNLRGAIMTNGKAILLGIFACATALMGGMPITDAAEVKALEQAYETSSDVTAIPTRAPSSMTVRACTNCPAQILRIDESTRFIVEGKHEVSLTQLLEACGRATFGFGVFYDARTNVVTRVVTQCPLPRLPSETTR